MKLALALLLSVSAFAATAEVYRYTDKDGVVHYTDQPPADNAKPVELPPLRTYEPGQLPTTGNRDESAQETRRVAYQEVRLVSPDPEETIRGAQRIVPVAITTTPALQEGHRVVYYLDGKPATGPETATSHVFTGIDRGEHTVAAAIVDGSGKELARAAAVTIYVKPPIAR